MQRPCFALAVLLSSMATSVLVVGKVNSQPVVTATVGIPGPMTACGRLADVLVLGAVFGQSSELPPQGWMGRDEDFVASEDGSWWCTDWFPVDEVAMADESSVTEPSPIAAVAAEAEISAEPAAPADSEVTADPVATVVEEVSDVREMSPVWFIPLGTGYDGAYDLAMFDGCFADVKPSQTDIDRSLVTVASDEHSEAISYLTDGPTNLISCEDFDFCLEGERCTMWHVRPSGQATDDNQVAVHEDPSVVESTEACWPIATVDAAADLRACEEWTQRTLLTVQEWWSIANSHPVAVRMWEATHAPIVANDGNAVEVNAVADNPVEINPGIPVSGIPVSTDTAIAVPADFSEEVLLIVAADTLDRIGLTLQDTAQQLRRWAADLIVMKGPFRKVAQKADR